MLSQPLQLSRQEKLRSVTISPTSHSTLAQHPDKRHPPSHGSISMTSKHYTGAINMLKVDTS